MRSKLQAGREAARRMRAAATLQAVAMAHLLLQLGYL
jgi:hypothetical protein